MTYEYGRASRGGKVIAGDDDDGETEVGCTEIAAVKGAVAVSGDVRTKAGLLLV